MEEIDIWRSAHQFMKMHGEDAAFVAANLADARLANGDAAGFRVWQRIVAAITEMSRTKPNVGETKN